MIEEVVVRQKHMGELVPRSYLWLEKLVADKCKELKTGEKDGVEDAIPSEVKYEGREREGSIGKETSKARLKGKEKEKERDSKDFSPALEPLDGDTDTRGKGIPTIPWTQFIKLGNICTIKVCYVCD